ncbi:MAG: hypothetical protein K5695_01140 [Oscillospiraceae bacterium]|nr:hypothetical protein [Oscillospiraceae bacterium]
MNSEETMQRFLELFPEKQAAFQKHSEAYGEILQHPFYAETVNYPLKELLEADTDPAEIRKYCRFIEQMVFDGDEDVKNVADVTILECLSDDKTIWHRFAAYSSNELIRYINTRLLHENIAMSGVEPLAYHGRNYHNG